MTTAFLMLTAEDVVRHVATECAYVDDNDGDGTRLKPAAAICGTTAMPPVDAVSKAGRAG